MAHVVAKGRALATQITPTAHEEGSKNKLIGIAECISQPGSLASERLIAGRRA